MENHAEKLSRILRIDKKILTDLENRLSIVTGKKDVFQKINQESDELVIARRLVLGLPPSCSAHEVYDALISKVESDDFAILKALKTSGMSHAESAVAVVNLVKGLHPPTNGFFLKYDKAKELLRAEPPKKILEAMGYASVEELIEKEDLLEVFSALRFLEESEWLNTVFFKQYEKLTPDDFENRPIQLRALNAKWGKAAEKFVAKKYHNVSHLKEMGVIFVIPLFLGISGESLRLISLLLHYLNEVKYYSEVFQDLSSDAKTFAPKLISLLRGDVVESRLPEPTDKTKTRILVIQRYLAKDDDNDWRLFEPHINPEALHWEKAEEEIQLINTRLPGFVDNLEFWKGLGTVGDFFKTDIGTDVLVSFNIVDTVMALVKNKELIKYLYHHQEALWNRIFEEYFGKEQLREMSKKYLLQGWFEI